MPQEQTVLFTLFGATGDLAKRKLYPSLFRLYQKGVINHHFAVIGTARREWSHEFFRKTILDIIYELEPGAENAEAFASHFYYQPHNVTDQAHYVALRELADRLDQDYQIGGNRLFYLAMAPNFFGTITERLKSEHIVSENGFNRLIIEKPFGTDYKSALALNQQIRRAFREDQIFRIDHYLGKEMIQNISAIRFGNNIFESLWNKNYIDNIQVTFSESLGVEDRGGYYDQSGALKDMVQNHILQVVSLLAMEPPAVFSEAAIRNEKIKALKSVRIYSPEEAGKAFVRGQYAAGHLEDKTFRAYREEPNVDPDSNTETFVAGKFLIDNFRWAGVPFYVRTGKRLTEKGTRINIVFKPVPINLFRQSDAPVQKQMRVPANVLTIYIQPTEGFSLTLNGKRIGQGFDLLPVRLNYRHSAETTANTPEAYEKLLLDCLKGDGTNFTHWDEVAQSWRVVDVIREVWDTSTPDFPNYASGTMGPESAFTLLEQDGFEWFWQPDVWYREKGHL